VIHSALKIMNGNQCRNAPLLPPPRLLGDWSGDSTQFTSWLPTKEHQSKSTLVVAPAAKGKFLTFTYTWSHEGREHEGLLLVGNQNEKHEATGAWVDSWHMSGGVWPCKGSVSDDGVVKLLGSYEAPPGPDWGWRIEISATDGRSLTLRMFNISPEGMEEPAVVAEYQKR
jgi:hypothetical protein